MTYIPKLSWTKLNMLRTCPFKYNQCYNLFKWSPPNITMTFGIACHTIFGMMYATGNFERKYWYDKWEDIFKAAIKNQKYLPKPTKKEYTFPLNKGYGMLKRFFETGDTFNVLKKVDKDLIEKKISLAVCGEPFVGYIDLLLPINDTDYMLVDFKTSQKKSKSDLGQVLVYALLAQQLKYNITKVAVFYPWLNDIVIVDFTDKYKRSAINYLKKIITLYKELQTTKKYEPRRNDYCKYCHVRVECPIVKTRKKK